MVNNAQWEDPSGYHGRDQRGGVARRNKVEIGIDVEDLHVPFHYDRYSGPATSWLTTAVRLSHKQLAYRLVDVDALGGVGRRLGDLNQGCSTTLPINVPAFCKVFSSRN